MVVPKLYSLTSSQVEGIKELIEEWNPIIHFEMDRLWTAGESVGLCENSARGAGPFRGITLGF